MAQSSQMRICGSGGGPNVKWNSTVMLNDPQNDSNPAVFISIFFRQHQRFFAPAWNVLVQRFTTKAFCGTVVSYSFELKKNGTDPHLIAFYSTGALSC